MIQKAKFQQPYNPLRQSIHIYMDTINIFWRMLALLQGGGRRK
jgi:FtsH-binding integral membrane protein